MLRSRAAAAVDQAAAATAPTRSRCSTTAAAVASSASVVSMCPHPASATIRAPGIAPASSRRDGHQRVLLPVHDRHRQPAQLRQPPARVVAGDGAQLGDACAHACRLRQPDAQVVGDALGPLVPRALGVQHGRDEVERALRSGQRPQRGRRQQPPRRHAAPPHRRRAPEDQRAHPRPVLEREVLGDHPAHRDADHVRALVSGGVEHGERVGHQVVHRQQPARRVRLAGPAVVEHQAPHRARQVSPQPAPRPAAARQPHDHQQRLARSRLLVGERHRTVAGDHQRPSKVAWPGPRSTNERTASRRSSVAKRSPASFGTA